LTGDVEIEKNRSFVAGFFVPGVQLSEEINVST
jgi:hypothetical protein